jgi:hypothetical protein
MEGLKWNFNVSKYSYLLTTDWFHNAMSQNYTIYFKNKIP